MPKPEIEQVVNDLQKDAPYKTELHAELCLETDDNVPIMFFNAKVKLTDEQAKTIAMHLLDQTTLKTTIVKFNFVIK